MQKKLAILTGGTGYLGAALTHELESRGWQVAALSRSSDKFPCDVTNAASVVKAVESAVATFGPVYAAIHAASAPLMRVAAQGASTDDIALQRSVALVGVQNLFAAVAPHMLPQGTFVAVTSDATKSQTEHKMGGYVEAKKEMEAYVRSLSAPFKVELFSIGFLPGGLNSDLPLEVRNFLGSKSKPVEEVAKEIADRLDSY